LKCPLCGKETKETINMPYDRPWVSVSPIEGLSIYGPYSSDKGIYCEWKIANHAWGLHLGDKLILKDTYDGKIPREVK